MAAVPSPASLPTGLAGAAIVSTLLIVHPPPSFMCHVAPEPPPPSGLCAAPECPLLLAGLAGASVMSVLPVALPPLLFVGHVALELPPPSEYRVLFKFLLPSPGLPLPSVPHAMFVLPLP